MGDEVSRLLVLRRLRSQPEVVAAVLLSILLATTLLAVGPVLATAVADGGLRADLEQAAPAEIGVEVTARTDADRAPEVAAALHDLLVDRFGDRVDPPDAEVGAGTVDLAGTADDVVTPLVVADGYPGAPLGPGGLLEVVEEAGPPNATPPPPRGLLHTDAVVPLGTAVGELVTVDDVARIRIGATVAPRDVTDRRWWDRPDGRDAVVPGAAFTEVGPLYVPGPTDLVALAGDDARVEVRVRTLPVLATVTPASLGELEREAAALEDRVGRVLGDGLADIWTVQTPLADAAAAATVALAATRAAVVASVAQVAVLALYALGLAGRLLRSGREVETMLVRARGATPEQLGRAAVWEGVVLVVPAVALAPWSATLVVDGLTAIGALGEGALTLQPVPSLASLAAAAAAGVACLVVLAAPAVTASRRTYASTRAGQGRRGPVGVAQALGLDLALVVVAAIGIWQLRVTGGPVSTTPQGPGDVDPVLVVAPALGLLAGALLVLRVVPVLAAGGDRVAGRARGLVLGLGGWQVARRPDAVARPTLLLVLAVAVGVLATTYGATWRVAQADQAAAAVGAPVVVEPDQRPVALSDPAVAATMAADPAVDRVRPAVVRPVRVGADAAGGTLVALDPASPLLVTRDDTRPSVAWSLLDVPPVPGMQLPRGDELVLPVTLAEDRTWPDQTVTITPVLRDGFGLVHQLPGRSVPAGPTARPTWPVGALARPVALLALDLTTRAGAVEPSSAAEDRPDPPRLDLRIAPAEVDGTATAPVDHTATAPVDDTATAAVDDWATDPWTSAALLPPELDDSTAGRDGWRVTGHTGLAGDRGRRATLRLVHAAAATPPATAVPAVVHPDVLAASGRAVGDDLAVTIGGTPLRVRVVGTAPIVPGQTSSPAPLVVDLDAVARANWSDRRAPTTPDRWHLALRDDLDAEARLAASERLAAELAAPPVAAPEVRTIAGDEQARRADPIAVGLLAALTLGALAAVGLALLGTVTTAVVGVRERAAEFALLQAVGTSVRQLRWWLAGEVAVVVVVGLGAGGLLGAVLVWAVLPTIALAADGTTAVPSPVVVVPAGTLAVAAAAVVAAFALVPVVLARVVARAHVAEVLRLGEDV